MPYLEFYYFHGTTVLLAFAGFFFYFIFTIFKNNLNILHKPVTTW